MNDSKQDPWICRYCATNDISIYGDKAICNRCLRSFTIGRIFHDLEDK